MKLATKLDLAGFALAGWVTFLIMTGSVSDTRAVVTHPSSESVHRHPVSDLSNMAHHVLREGGTEPAFSGRFFDHKANGEYFCAGCGTVLFDSASKYDSKTGWPSFFKPVDSERIVEKVDRKFGMRRTEVVCQACDGHLGHVFPDGPDPTGLRYCINSAALGFAPMAAKPPQTVSD